MVKKEVMKDKCKCRPCIGVGALIFSVVGIYSIILGIKTQWTSSLVFTNWLAMAYYLLGVLVMSLARISKHHAYETCDVHKMK